MCTENKHTQTIDIAIGPIGIAADIANPNKSNIGGIKKLKSVILKLKNRYYYQNYLIYWYC